MEVDRTSKELSDAGAPSNVQYTDIPGVPSRIVKICVLQQIVRPEQRDGLMYFSSQDMLFFKLVHSMVLGFRIEAELKRSFDKAKIEPAFRNTILAIVGEAGALVRIAIELAADNEI
jgi:hypothetical protein